MSDELGDLIDKAFPDHQGDAIMYAAGYTVRGLPGFTQEQIDQVQANLAKGISAIVIEATPKLAEATRLIAQAFGIVRDAAEAAASNLWRFDWGISDDPEFKTYARRCWMYARRYERRGRKMKRGRR